MKILHVFELAALAAILFCAPQLQAQDAAWTVGGAVLAGHMDAVPDAAAAMYQGIVALGAAPPTGNPDPSWPCVGGGTDTSCSGIAAGGFVIPFPYQVVPLKASAEVVSTFSTTTASGTAAWSIKLIQAKKVIYRYSSSLSVAANSTYYMYSYGPGLLAKAKAGTVSILTTVTVGTSTIHGHTTVQVQ
jgi:hypothetical protein